VFKAPLEIALEAYFADQSVAVLEGLFNALNSIDMRSVPLPNYLQQEVIVRKGIFFNDKNVLDHWTHESTMNYMGRGNQTYLLICC